MVYGGSVSRGSGPVRTMTKSQHRGGWKNAAVQGLYRVRVGAVEMLESFVAAPGPMGWRYFGRLRDPATERELARIDHVVDNEWNLVRFRWSEQDGPEVVAVPSSGGVEVTVAGPAGERTAEVSGAEAVWSASPSSLLVMDRLIANTTEVRAVLLLPPFEPRAVVVRVTPAATRRVATPSGRSEVREVVVELDGLASRAVLRADLPLRAEDWFELVE